MRVFVCVCVCVCIHGGNFASIKLAYIFFCKAIAVQGIDRLYIVFSFAKVKGMFHDALTVPVFNCNNEFNNININTTPLAPNCTDVLLANSIWAIDDAMQTYPTNLVKFLNPNSRSQDGPTSNRLIMFPVKCSHPEWPTTWLNTRI